jgi:hypothetical protein
LDSSRTGTWPFDLPNLQLTFNSPRWLLERDRLEDAAISLAVFRPNSTTEELQTELNDIHANILWHKTNSVGSAKVLFTNKSFFARLWRAWVLNLLQQMSGAAGIRYYLPANFRAAGTSEDIALLASGIDGSVQVACTVVGLLLIDRIGRRHALGFGAGLMAFCLMVT